MLNAQIMVIRAKRMPPAFFFCPRPPPSHPSRRGRKKKDEGGDFNFLPLPLNSKRMPFFYPRPLPRQTSPVTSNGLAGGGGEKWRFICSIASFFFSAPAPPVTSNKAGTRKKKQKQLGIRMGAVH